MQPHFVRIVYAEDQTLLRRLFEMLLEENHRYQVVASCRNGIEALQEVRRHKPDILLLDLNMPVMNGHEVIDELRKEGHCVKIIMLSMYEDEKLKLLLLSKGVKGFISKEAEQGEIYESIDLVARGMLCAPGHLVSIRMNMDKSDYDAAHVTDEDLELAALLKKGLPVKVIAPKMGKSVSGIEKMKTALVTKLHAQSLYDAVDVLGQEGFMFRKEG